MDHHSWEHSCSQQSWQIRKSLLTDSAGSNSVQQREQHVGISLLQRRSGSRRGSDDSQSNRSVAGRTRCSGRWSVRSKQFLSVREEVHHGRDAIGRVGRPGTDDRDSQFDRKLAFLCRTT